MITSAAFSSESEERRANPEKSILCTWHWLIVSGAWGFSAEEVELELAINGFIFN